MNVRKLQELLQGVNPEAEVLIRVGPRGLRAARSLCLGRKRVLPEEAELSSPEGGADWPACMNREAKTVVIENVPCVADYSGLPESLRDGARLWIEHGVVPGGFLCAVIKNDLEESFALADAENGRLLCDIVRWWYNEAPGGCWGSVEEFKAWQRRFDPQVERETIIYEKLGADS